MKFKEYWNNSYVFKLTFTFLVLSIPFFIFSFILKNSLFFIIGFGLLAGGLLELLNGIKYAKNYKNNLNYYIKLEGKQ